MAYVALATALLGTTLLAGRLPAGGWSWDLLNGLGLGACALLVELGRSSASPPRQPGLALHRRLAEASALLVLAHAIGLLVLEPTLLVWLTPEGPGYLLAGIAGGIGVLVLTVSAWPGPRRRLFAGRAFRSWHRATSLLVVPLVAWHVAGAGFYLSTPVAVGAFLALAAGLPLGAWGARRLGRRPGPDPADPRLGHAFLPVAGTTAGLVVLFALVRNL